MTSELPDGRVPMNVLLDEKDEELSAEWDAADAEALSALDTVLDGAGERPLPLAELTAAAARLREVLARPGWPAELLIECGGVDPKDLPADDTELWLALAAGVASPVDGDDWTPGEPGDPDDADELSETDNAVASICAIDHFDWLAVISELASGGPGTAASAADLAGYVRDFDPDDIVGEEDAEDDEDEEEDDLAFEENEDDDEFGLDDDFDELGMEGLFLPVTTLWQVLGAIDEEDRLTALGWWGLPEAMRRVWAAADGLGQRLSQRQRVS
jgi:hypothetical protein